MFSKAELARDFRRLGVAPGDTVMLHASVRAVGEIAHVARFVVWGQQAEYLISEQPWNYAFGRGSLFERFLKAAGKILLLGSDHDNVTFLHYVEYIGEFPGKRVARYRVLVEENGMRVWREMEEFDTSGKGVHPNFPDGFFARLVAGYLDERRNAGARVGIAAGFLFPAQELMDFAMPRMTSVATAESRTGDSGG